MVLFQHGVNIWNHCEHILPYGRPCCPAYTYLQEITKKHLVLAKKNPALFGDRMIMQKLGM